MSDIEVGAMIHAAWKQSGMKQKDVLRLMGITRSHFNKIVRAEYSASVQFLDDFARTIGKRLVVEVT